MWMSLSDVSFVGDGNKILICLSAPFLKNFVSQCFNCESADTCGPVLAIPGQKINFGVHLIFDGNACP